MKYLSNLFLSKHSILALLLLAILTNPLHSQQYKFEKYGIEQGICHTSIYTINQDSKGYLWIGTGQGLCRFDGYEFVSGTTFDSIPESPVEVSCMLNNGHIWFGHSDGNITIYNGRNFINTETNEVITSKIVKIIQDSENKIWVATQSNGIFVFNNDLSYEKFDKEFENIWISNIEFASGNKLIVGTLEGLYIYSCDTKNKPLKVLKKFEELDFVHIISLYKITDKQFYLGAEDMGLYQLDILEKDDYKLLNIDNVIGLEKLNIQYITIDLDSNTWIATFGNGLYKITPSNSEKPGMVVNYNDENGLGSTFIKTLFQDRDGNLWMGTYDNGLARLMDESMVYYDLTEYKLSASVFSIYIEGNTIWYSGRSVILKEERGAENKYTLFDQRNGLPRTEITTLYLDKNKDLWIGTTQSGVYKKKSNSNSISRIYMSENSLENSINSIKGDEENVYVATNGGVTVFNLASGSIGRLTTTEGLPHNSIKDIQIDKQGIVWLATRSNGLHAMNSDVDLSIESRVEMEFTCIAEDEEGSLWAGTYGDGVFKFTKDTLIYYSNANGLYSNYCYSIIADGDFVWIGHRLGLSRINIKDNNIRSFGTEAGMTGDCNANAVATNRSGLVLFGTTTNIVQYDNKLDKKNINPPVINVTSIRLNDKEMPIENLVVPYGLYKMRIDFIGINYKAPNEVQYQYMLKGYDLEWSDLTSNRYVQYPRIEDGEYAFLIKAYNEEGICSERPLELTIKVRKPFWKTGWFIVTVIIVVIFSVYLIIRIRERKQIKFQQYLQEKLDERTKEVVEQKEEIESINRDITDSINYAQRIQASILPSMQKLQDNFTGSFVFYLPRDIVSGDFYWFDKTTDDTFIIVCADSTGHGVPGAFMSMIGTTLIKDICQRQDVNSPTQVLNVLDYEIQTTLNQSLEAGKSSDGMDIIVCEINVKTLRMRYASAMRPLLVYKEGDLVYYKGSQNSIGGEGEDIQKVFEEEEIKLSKGDIIYMFSDGYTDQFGGPHGKKFKMVRLKNLLKDIYEKPMEEQYKFVKNNFELWKDQFPQVDDVLFMGIKI